jgi:hypothetical protein
MDGWTDLDQAYLDIFGVHPDLTGLAAEAELDPKHDAIGKFVTACVGLESILNVTLSRLTGEPYVEVDFWNVATKLTRLREASFDEQSSRAFETIADRAAETFDFRNSVVHGIHMGDGEGRSLSQRPRKRKPRKVLHDRETLLIEGMRANQLRRHLDHEWRRWEQRTTVDTSADRG